MDLNIDIRPESSGVRRRLCQDSSSVCEHGRRKPNTFPCNCFSYFRLFSSLFVAGGRVLAAWGRRLWQAGPGERRSPGGLYHPAGAVPFVTGRQDQLQLHSQGLCLWEGRFSSRSPIGKYLAFHEKSFPIMVSIWPKDSSIHWSIDDWLIDDWLIDLVIDSVIDGLIDDELMNFPKREVYR